MEMSWNGRNDHSRPPYRVDERQTASGKLRRERLKIITADKDQPARKVSRGEITLQLRSTNQRKWLAEVK